MQAPELVHIAQMTAILGEQFVIKGGPVGTRIVANVSDVIIEGERLNARMVGQAAADWLTVGPDRTYGTLDVRATVKTDDDALIHVEYSGRINLVDGTIVAAPLFQTGDERYDWLNRIQVIGDGRNTEQGPVYQLWEVVNAPV